VQKNEVVDRQKELAEIAEEPFARMADDPKLDKMRKEVIREGDPMAQYVQQKRSKVSSQERGARSSKPEKPVYRGPAAPPNRFRILPGYRWDAIDRGNGFEHKVLLKQNDKFASKEDEYKWRSSDL
jgi:pre-mRNA-splicing factor CWC26